MLFADADNVSRLAAVPPEIVRLEDCVHELVAGKTPLPTGLPHSREAIREYFWGRVFPGVDHPTRLRAFEASRVTQIAGRRVTLEKVRQQVLNDIEELVTYMVSPVDEGIREDSKAPVATPVAGQPSNTQRERGNRAFESSKGQAFSNQLKTVESRSSGRSRAQSREGEWFSMGQSIDQRRHVKTQSTVDEASLLSKPQLGRLCIAENAEFLENSATPRQQTVNEHALGVGFDQERTVPSSKSQVPYGEGNVTHAAPGPFAYGVPPQHLTLGGYHLPMYAAPAFGGQMASAQNPWTVQQGPYGVFPPLPYANPWQQPYAQYASAYGQPPMGAYVPPPMPNAHIHARPPATNRVARLFAQAGLPTLETTQARPYPQNAEWQNRYAIQPSVVPDVPILPYRVGSDDMYPHPTGTASFRYQNLTRTNPLSVDLATAEENVPFAENARLTKPPPWGVMKIGNVSLEHLDRCGQYDWSS